MTAHRQNDDMPQNLTALLPTNVTQTSYTDLGRVEIVHSILGIPLNLIAFSFAKRACRHHKYRHQILVISMAIADLLLTTFHSTYTFIRYGLSIAPPARLTIFTYIITYLCTISSSLSLLLLNIDKFIFVYCPLRYEPLVTRIRLAKGVCVAWLTALCWALLMLYGPWTRFHWKDGNFTPTHIEAYIAFMVLFFMLPNIASFGISCYIVHTVRKHREAIARSSSAASSVEDQLNPSNRGRLYIPFKSILFVFSATSWCILTTIPYRLGFILIYLRFTTDTRAVFGLFVWMGFNAVGNPIITLLTHRTYRRRIFKFLRLREKENGASVEEDYSAVTTHLRDRNGGNRGTPKTV